MIGPALVGFGTGFSLILAIGAQNAFVLRHGLMRQHVFWLCLFCASSDAILIACGVAGFGAIVKAVPLFPLLMSIGGALFLIIYGISKLRAAFSGGERMELSGEVTTLKSTLLTAAAFTWLNPHVYVDTLGLIGAISTQYGDFLSKIYFGAAAVFASFVFFFGLGYGARLLAPIMQSAKAWRRLDFLIGCVMLWIAAGLLHHAYGLL
ncbi:MAG: LysE/ArgO family amino acid transporter [Halocynthiibacter sp.]